MLRVLCGRTGQRPEFTVAWGNAPGNREITSRLAEGHIHNTQRTHEYGLQPKTSCFIESWGVAPGYGDKKAFGQIKTRNIKTHASGYQRSVLRRLFLNSMGSLMPSSGPTQDHAFVNGPRITAVETVTPADTMAGLMTLRIHTDAGTVDGEPVIGHGETYYIPDAAAAVIHELSLIHI